MCDVVQASVSVKRLRNFLKNEELNEDNVIHDSASGKGGFSWNLSTLVHSPDGSVGDLPRMGLGAL